MKSIFLYVFLRLD